MSDKMDIEYTSVSRRTVLAGIGATAAIGLPSGAFAQGLPPGDVRLICAFPPGSGADVIVRFMGNLLQKASGRTMIVENRTGAGGSIATEYAARAKPDGLTVFIHAGSAVAANMHLFKKPPVDAAKALQVVGTINKQPFMLVVDAKRPWKTVAELLTHLKERGDKASYATGAPTGTVMGELFKAKTGTKAVEVNFRNAPDSLNEMLNGTFDYGMHDPVFSLAEARKGTLRILGISNGTRMQANPDLATMTEQGVEMDLPGWWCGMVPSATPKPVVAELNKWFREVVALDETKKFLNQFGGDPWITSPEEGQAQLVKDIANWEGYIKVAKIEPQ